MCLRQFLVVLQLVGLPNVESVNIITLPRTLNQDLYYKEFTMGSETSDCGVAVEGRVVGEKKVVCKSCAIAPGKNVGCCYVRRGEKEKKLATVVVGSTAHNESFGGSCSFSNYTNIEER